MNSLLVCEGYQDRKFLSAWLDHLGGARIRNLTDKTERRIKVDDSHAKQCGERQIFIVPAKSYERVTSHTVQLLKKYDAQIDRVCLVVDADEDEPSVRKKKVQDSVSGRGHQAPEVIIWAPQLELIIEKALRMMNVAAMNAVDAFVDHAPGVSSTKKERVFAYCAAWEPDSFGESFFGLVWENPAIRGHLEPLVAEFRPQLMHLLGEVP